MRSKNYKNNNVKAIKRQPYRADLAKHSFSVLRNQEKPLVKSDLTSEKIRTRIPPSPTGFFHIGTARTALFNYLFAKKYGGKFIFRIEDTDLKRSDKKFEKDIIEGLKWLRLKWDNKLYRQSERLDIYEKYIKTLFNDGKTFWCYHTKKELEKEKEEQMERKESPKHICSHKSEIRNPKSETNSNLKIQNSKKGIIRLNTPQKIVKFNDLIRGEISFDASLFGDISLAKNERTPLYNLAVVIDDYEMKISHIIRGEDHISNTPKQILIQEALGFSVPHYAHLPLILGADKSKLSKRHGATSVSEYKEQGYLPEALINFIALLGFAPSDNREFFSLKDLIKEFSLERVQKGGAIFNIEKLDWLNGQYIRKKSLKDLLKLILEGDFLKFPISNFQFPKKYLEKIIKLEQPRLTKLSEITEKTNYFFEKLKYDKELLKWKNMSDNEIKESLKKSFEIASKIPEAKFKLKNIERIFLKEAEKIGDRGALLWPLRAALSGKKASPSPFEIADVLGKKEVLERINSALNRFMQ